MALIENNLFKNKTMKEFETFPHSKVIKQANFRIPENLLLSLKALSSHSNYNQGEIISLALFNMLGEKEYLHKKPDNKNIVVF